MMEKTKDSGLKIITQLEESNHIRILQNCLCLRFEVRKQEHSHELYEVIVNDYIDYFIYEFWYVEETTQTKSFDRKIEVTLTEFRAQYYVSVSATHEQIAEKMLEKIINVSNK